MAPDGMLDHVADLDTSLQSGDLRGARWHAGSLGGSRRFAVVRRSSWRPMACWFIRLTWTLHYSQEIFIAPDDMLEH